MNIKCKWIVNAIITDLSGRKGIGDEWDQIDSEIQDEIRSYWQKIVNDYLTGQRYDNGLVEK